MATVTIYTRPFCGYCARALSVLRAKGADVAEIDAGFDARSRGEMIARAGGASTFPQIFIGDAHVGGCDELLAMDARGELDARLGS